MKKQKRGEFVIAPVPLINPTLGNGLILGAGYLFKLDKNDAVSPPSMVGGAVFGTSNGSRGFGAAGQFHLKKDRYRLLIAGGKAKINMRFFGRGTDAGNAGVSIPLSIDGKGLLAEGLFRLHGKWYLGARYHIMKMRASLDREDDEGQPGGGPVIPPLDVELRTAALGPHLKYDGANDSFYPTKGSIFDLKIGFFGQAVGGNRTYRSYDISYNKYLSLNEKQVFAGRLAGCFIRGRAPFYDLCSVGLRGYEAGQYIDRNMLSGQLEFRQTLPKRFGFVVFGGLGEVANSFSDFSLNKMLPAGGAGLRFRLTKQSRINLRFDYAWGQGSSGLYIGVSEAF